MDVALRLTAKVTTALLAGAFLLGTAGLRRAVGRLEGPVQIRMRQAVIPPFRHLLLPMMLLAVAATGSAASFHAERSTAAGWVAFLLTCTVLGITIAINAPVNRQILSWSAETPPSDWREQIARWNVADWVRLVLSLAAFLCAEAS
jgi:hypothetical protein